MCEPKPAYRCSAHACKRLVAASTEGDPIALRKAQAAWERTAAYTKQLRTEANARYAEEVRSANAFASTDAGAAAEVRRAADSAHERVMNRAAGIDRERKALWKASKVINDPHTPLSFLSQAAENEKEHPRVRAAAAGVLHARVPFFNATFTKAQVRGIFGVTVEAD